MVWAIGTRLILSKAQKSAGTNGPNHAGRWLVGLVMEVSSGARPTAWPASPILVTHRVWWTGRPPPSTCWLARRLRLREICAGIEFCSPLLGLNQNLCAKLAFSPRRISVSSYYFCSEKRSGSPLTAVSWLFWRHGLGHWRPPHHVKRPQIGGNQWPKPCG